MKRFAATLAAAALLALPYLATATDTEQSAPGGKTVAEYSAAKNATVKSIDMKTRNVTLAFEDGTEHTMVVDKAVKKLDQVKVGDVVKVRYHEALSVKLNKTKVKPETTVGGSIQRHDESVKPSGRSTMIVTTTATIDKVMEDGKMVTLRMPDGTTTDVQVRDPQNVAKLKKGEVKQGDQIEITYKRAVAVSVEKGAK